MRHFDQSTTKALHIDNIYLMIKPFSEIGKKEKKNFKVFRSGDDQKANNYYKKLSTVINTVKKFPETLSYIGSTLNHFEDISHLFKSANKRTYEMHELFEIKHFLYFYKNLCNQLQEKDLSIKIDKYSPNSKYIIPSRNFKTLFTLLDIDEQNSPSFYLSVKYSEKFKSLKDELHNLKTQIEKSKKEYSKKIIQELNIKKFEETVTVSRLNQDLVNKLLDSKYFYIDSENFANVILKIRIPSEIYDTEIKIINLNEELEKEAIIIRKMLSENIFAFKEELQRAIDETGFFDLLFSKAIFAKNNNCVIPEILNTESKVSFIGTNTFNIFLKTELKKLNIDYQSISLKISNQVNLITGSNMGGKTSILKTIGQIAFMTQLGLPVPAENVSIKLFDNIFFSGPITQEDRADLSSFGYEVFTLQNVINTKGKTLFLLDEFGRGTNPVEGQALAQSVMHYFSNQSETTLISATHYSPPKNLTNFTHFQMVGLSENFIHDLKSKHQISLTEKLKIIHNYMNYQPVEVTQNEDVPKSALKIAELLGLNEDILKLAEKLSNE